MRLTALILAVIFLALAGGCTTTALDSYYYVASGKIEPAPAQPMKLAAFTIPLNHPQSELPTHNLLAVSNPDGTFQAKFRHGTFSANYFMGMTFHRTQPPPPPDKVELYMLIGGKWKMIEVKLQPQQVRTDENGGQVDLGKVDLNKAIVPPETAPTTKPAKGEKPPKAPKKGTY